MNPSRRIDHEPLPFGCDPALHSSSGFVTFPGFDITGVQHFVGSGAPGPLDVRLAVRSPRRIPRLCGSPLSLSLTGSPSESSCQKHTSHCGREDADLLH
jgi:hypothetical protein